MPYRRHSYNDLARLPLRTPLDLNRGSVDLTKDCGAYCGSANVIRSWQRVLRRMHIFHVHHPTSYTIAAIVGMWLSIYASLLLALVRVKNTSLFLVLLVLRTILAPGTNVCRSTPSRQFAAFYHTHLSFKHPPAAPT